MQEKKNAGNLFLDSGIGGLTTLIQAQHLLPKEDFIYCADFANSPYGDKSKAQVRDIVLERIDEFCAQFQPKSIVLACNTATAVGVSEVRKNFPELVVIGAEPAIRPPVQAGLKRILVLGTALTLKYNKVVKLFKMKYPTDITLCALPDLARLIDEKYASNPQIIHNFLVEKLSPYHNYFDAVVLGCTHYVLVQGAIKQILGDKCSLFHGNFGIAKHLKECLGLLKLQNEKGGRVTLVSTSPEKQKSLENIYKYISEWREDICVV